MVTHAWTLSPLASTGVVYPQLEKSGNSVWPSSAITVSPCAPRVAVLLLGFEQCSHLLWPSAQHTDLFRHVEMLYIEISDVADWNWSLGSTSTSTWVWNRLFSCLQRSLWRSSRLSSKSKFVFLKEKKNYPRKVLQPETPAHLWTLTILEGVGG